MFQQQLRFGRRHQTGATGTRTYKWTRPCTTTAARVQGSSFLLCVPAGRTATTPPAGRLSFTQLYLPHQIPSGPFLLTRCLVHKEYRYVYSIENCCPAPGTAGLVSFKVIRFSLTVILTDRPVFNCRVNLHLKGLDVPERCVVTDFRTIQHVPFGKGISTRDLRGPCCILSGISRPI